MCSFIQELNEEPPPKYEPNKEQIKHEDFKCLKEVSSIHHEYVYHHEITEDVSSNTNVPQSYPSSLKCWMKFLQHQMNQVLSKKNHESSSDSNAYHRSSM